MGEQIELKRISADDPIKLSILKSHFNRLANQLNVRIYHLSQKQRKDIADQIKVIEIEINNYK